MSASASRLHKHVLLQFFSTGLAIIKVEESDRTQPPTELGLPKAIQFRSERFKRLKTALPVTLDVRNGVHIRIIFNHLHGKSRAVMATLPPVH